MLTWDPTINLGEVLLIGGGLLTFLKVVLALRDNMRDTQACVRALQQMVEDHEERIRLCERRQR